ncbi:MAG: hypothetical protein JNM68_10425 [Dinghuibacter sp.]|nr:hypothetical protein [Dinghuibacter sp.]
MNKTCWVILFTLLGMAGQAQYPGKQELKQLKAKEDTLSILSWRIGNEISPANRLTADSFFVRVLVRAMAVKNSFGFPFDSVMMQRVYAPDSSFRIFTWQVDRSRDQLRQRGVIQYKTPDGSLRMTPLIDNSEFTEDVFTTNTNKNWIGALYYKIILNEHEGKKYYTLLGLDDNNAKSTKKWIDVLTFENGQPVFGHPVFKNLPNNRNNRYVIEYKKDARARLTWDEEQQMIVFDHLVSETGFVNQRHTFVPDGDYEGLKWENGFWVYQPKIMCNCPLSNEKIDPLLGKPPVGDPLFDKEGVRDEKKIQDKSKKNGGGGE